MQTVLDQPTANADGYSPTLAADDEAELILLAQFMSHGSSLRWQTR